jgi:hypothetical protein
MNNEDQPDQERLPEKSVDEIRQELENQIERNRELLNEDKKDASDRGN